MTFVKSRPLRVAWSYTGRPTKKKDLTFVLRGFGASLWVSYQTGIMTNIASTKNCFPGYAVMTVTSSSLRRSIDEYLFTAILHQGVSSSAKKFLTNVLFISAYIRSVPQCNAHSALSNETQMLTGCFLLGE